MKEGLIGVIVPVYNTEKYIRKCLDSIIAQTYTNWEAILVNDGSTDNSGKICDEYAAKDNRFKVIHQENGGVSVARQTGLDNATGGYIIHCDPDDWIEPTMLEEMLQCSISNNADMVICDIAENNNGKINVIQMDLPTIEKGKNIQRLLVEQKLHGSCCNKLVKAELCKKVRFYPKEITLSEDELYNIRLLNQNLKVCYVPKALYNYRIDNQQSLCHSNDAKIITSKTIIINELEKFLDKEDFENFIVIKETILRAMFMKKLFKEMKSTFTEVHGTIIGRHKKYRITTPLGYCFEMALKGRFRTGYYLYYISMQLLKLGKSIKNILHKIK